MQGEGPWVIFCAPGFDIKKFNPFFRNNANLKDDLDKLWVAEDFKKVFKKQIQKQEAHRKNKNEYPKATAFMFRALALLDSQSGNKNDALIEIDRGIKILEGENVKVEIPFNDSLKMLSPNILNPELIEFYLTRTQICLDGKDLTCAKKSIQIAKKLTPDYHRITKYELLIKMTEQTNI